METSWRVVVITGPVGSGKSTTLEALSGVLDRAGVRHVAVDMDQIRLVFPRAPDDPFAVRLGLANLASMVPNIRAERLGVLLLADVVEDPSQRRLYADACPGAEVDVVRLSVPVATMLDRLRGRETDETLAWYLDRAVELDRLMGERGVGDVVVSVDDRTPAAVAAEIADVCGLLPGQLRPDLPSTA